MATHIEQSKILLDPILDLAGGTDGGIAFAKLSFQFLPEMLSRAEQGEPMAEEFVLMITRFSTLCKTLMEQS